MHIHVHLVGRQREEQSQHRVPPLRQQIAIGRAHGAVDQLVAHGPSIDDEILLERVRPVEGRKPGEAFEHEAAAHRAERQSIGHEFLAEDAAEPVEPMLDQPRLARIEAQDNALAIGEAEADIRIGEREPLHRIGDCPAFRALRLHEFEPSGGGIEKIAHLDARSGFQGRGPELRFPSAFDGDLMRVRRASRAARDRESRHRPDRGQRLAAKAECEDRGERVVIEL